MSDFPTTRLSLLMRVRDHADHQAWSDFLALYRPALYRFARRRGMQEADAQDLAQAVLTAVAERIRDWNPDPQRARFRTWLSRVAQNQAISMYRRTQADAAKGGPSMVSRLEEHAAEEQESEQLLAEYQREIFRHAARTVRQEFAETTWQAFWLTAVEQVPVTEVAKSLGRTTGSVYTSRSRVIRRLQEVVRILQREDDTLSSP